MQLLIEYVQCFLHTSKKVVPFTYNHVINRPKKSVFSKNFKPTIISQSNFLYAIGRKNHCRGEREAPAANTRRTVNILQKALEGYEEPLGPPSPWP